MTLVLISTPGAPNANSYCTAVEGDAYHESRLYATAWTGASPSIKEAALVMATRMLDQAYQWEGYPSVDMQALDWPRGILLGRNERDFTGQTEIPLALKYATAEFARQLIEKDLSKDSIVEVQGVRSLTAGPVSIAFKDDVKAKTIPDAVANMIPRWWGQRRSRKTRSRDVVRV